MSFSTSASRSTPSLTALHAHYAEWVAARYGGHVSTAFPTPVRIDEEVLVLLEAEHRHRHQRLLAGGLQQRDRVTQRGAEELAVGQQQQVLVVTEMATASLIDAQPRMTLRIERNDASVARRGREFNFRVWCRHVR
jgi:hypothetical protein